MMLLASQRLLALTRPQFDAWEKKRQAEYLKKHPNSSFHDKNSTKPDDHRTRLARKGEGHFTFTDNNGKTHSYKSADDVEKHLDKMHAQMDKLAQQYHKGQPGGRIRDAAERDMQNLADHAKALQDLARNKTASKELGFGKDNEAQHGLDTVKQYLNHNKPKDASKAPAKKAPAKAPAKKTTDGMEKRGLGTNRSAEQQRALKDRLHKEGEAKRKVLRDQHKERLKQARELDEDDDIARDANKSKPKMKWDKEAALKQRHKMMRQGNMPAPSTPRGPAKAPAKPASPVKKAPAKELAPIKPDFSKHKDYLDKVAKMPAPGGFSGMGHVKRHNIEENEPDLDKWKAKMRGLHTNAEFFTKERKDSAGNKFTSTTAKDYEGSPTEHGSHTQFADGRSSGRVSHPVDLHYNAGKYSHATDKDGNVIHRPEGSRSAKDIATGPVSKEVENMSDDELLNELSDEEPDDPPAGRGMRKAPPRGTARDVGRRPKTGRSGGPGGSGGGFDF